MGKNIRTIFQSVKCGLNLGDEKVKKKMRRDKKKYQQASKYY